MMTEEITKNDVAGTPRISICIPTWKDAVTPLLSSLKTLTAIAQCEILIYDDGSNSPQLTAQLMSQVETIPAPTRLITASENRGRSFARNRLIAHARADWLLLLDADMLPDESHFIQRYINQAALCDIPSLIAGGFSLQQVKATPGQRLHAAQSQRSECLSAAARAKEPGLHVFTSNILVHRKIIEQVLFDEGYAGWGWEDVDWGLRVGATFPILHIENTATHLGLDDTTSLLNKYAGSKTNFARLANQHPKDVAQMRIYQASKKMRHMPFRSLVGMLAKTLARDPLGITPISVRLLSLKLFRASIYAEVLK